MSDRNKDILLGGLAGGAIGGLATGSVGGLVIGALGGALIGDLLSRDGKHGHFNPGEKEIREREQRIAKLNELCQGTPLNGNAFCRSYMETIRALWHGMVKLENMYKEYQMKQRNGTALTLGDVDNANKIFQQIEVRHNRLRAAMALFDEHYNMVITAINTIRESARSKVITLEQLRMNLDVIISA